uniref:Protein amnionless n=1 Tax=Culex tarsalis TaxID=7177 RepID=A0A1Q3FPW4_CULTA
MKTLTLCLALLFSACNATVSKVWRHNLNYDNPLNWQSQRVPQSGRDIYFPKKLNSIVKLPNTVNVASITLPLKGALLIPDSDFSMVFQSGHRSQESVGFNVPIRRPYYSTSNWRTLVDPGSKELPHNSAIPHTQRIPCQYETAIFPDAPGPVDLQYHEAIEVKDVLFGSTQGLGEFRTFLSTELGQMVFLNAEETITREGKCPNPEKCKCQPDWVTNNGVICDNEVCPIPRCIDPIVPSGHCCAVCGSMLTVGLISFGSPFEEKVFSEKLNQKIKLSDVDISTIDYHVDVQNNTLQLVILDKGEYDGRSVRLMKSLDSFFVKHFRNGKSAHIVLNSGHPYMPYESGQLFFVLFFSLLVVSIFFTALYVYYYDDSIVPRVTAMIRSRRFFTSPFVFARFDPNNENGESTLDINFAAPSGIENLNSSFNNPMFEENATAGGSSAEEKSPVDEEPYVDVELKSQD